MDLPGHTLESTHPLQSNAGGKKEWKKYLAIKTKKILGKSGFITLSGGMSGDDEGSSSGEDWSSPERREWYTKRRDDEEDEGNRKIVKNSTRLLYLPDWNDDETGFVTSGTGFLSRLNYDTDVSALAVKFGHCIGRRAVVVEAKSNFPYMSSEYEISIDKTTGDIVAASMVACNISSHRNGLPELGFRPPLHASQIPLFETHCGNIGILDPMIKTDEPSVVHIHVPHEEWYNTYVRSEVLHNRRGKFYLIDIRDPSYELVQCYMEHAYRSAAWQIGLIEFLDSGLVDYGEKYMGLMEGSSRVQIGKTLRSRSLRRDALQLIESTQKQLEAAGEKSSERMKRIECIISGMDNFGGEVRTPSSVPMPYCKYAVALKMIPDIFELNHSQIREKMVNVHEEYPGDEKNVLKALKCGCRNRRDLAVPVVCYDDSEHINRAMMHRRLGKTGTGWTRFNESVLQVGGRMNISKLPTGVYYSHNLLWKKTVWDTERKDAEERDMKLEMDWSMLYMWRSSHPSTHRSTLYAIRFVKPDRDYVFMREISEKKYPESTPFKFDERVQRIDFDQSFLPAVVEINRMIIEVTGYDKIPLKDRYHRTDSIVGNIEEIEGIACVYDGERSGFIFSQKPGDAGRYIFGGTHSINCINGFTGCKMPMGDVVVISTSDVMRMACLERYLMDTYQVYRSVIKRMREIDLVEKMTKTQMRNAVEELNVLWRYNTYELDRK